MTQEQKDLLLKDISARLPYGVKFQSENIETVLYIDTSDDEVWINGTCIDDFKPYLLPMSSMTEEQKDEFIDTCTFLRDDTFGWTDRTFDWLNKNHFDYRDLIPMGLANNATGLNIY